MRERHAPLCLLPPRSAYSPNRQGWKGRSAMEMTPSEVTARAPFVIEGPLGQRLVRQAFMDIPFNPDPGLYQGILDEIEDGVYMVDRTRRLQSRRESPDKALDPG